MSAVVGGVRPRIALLNYGMGNLRSVEKALQHEGAEVVVARTPSEAAGATGVVLPGVGAVGDCVEALRRSGLDDFVRGWIAEDRPFLGVCLGLQALFDWSEENGGVACLGVFPGKVQRFRLPVDYKVPHMGWNTVRWTRPGLAIAAGLEESPRQFYFVHSYHCVPEDPELAAGISDYGGDFVAAVCRGRVQATQFHPEKSQEAGLRIYRNFVSLAA
jgi:glutamine amidotransferase